MASVPSSKRTHALPLPFEALFDARTALFEPILVAQAGEPASQVSEAVASS
jgi:hypothetical protein